MIEKNMVHSGVAYIKEHVPDKRLDLCFKLIYICVL